MGVPLNLKDIQSGFLTASAFTSNNTLIEEAMNKALDRTGSSDNAMEVDLDMGLNWINNLEDAYLDHQATPFGQVSRLVTASGDQVTSTADRDNFIATAGQTLFTLSNIEYIQGTNSLIVFVNGVYQLVGTDYTETSTTSITFDSGLNEGDIVVVIGARFNAEVFVTESSGFADAAEASATAAEASATDAETAQAEAEAAAGYKLGINNQSGTSYTLVLSDEGDLVRMTNAAANTVTVPDNASVAFEIGTIVNVRQSGAGTTTISPAAGVTINAPQDEFTTDGEEFGVALVKVATDEWDLVKSYAGVRNDEFDADVSPTIGGEGYQKLPSGLIMQWGSGSAAFNSSDTYSFPIAFPTSCINVQVTGITPAAYVSSGIQESSITVRNITSTSFEAFHSWVGDTGGTTSSMTFHWFALGA